MRTNVNTEHKRMLSPAQGLRTQGSQDQSVLDSGMFDLKPAFFLSLVVLFCFVFTEMGAF